MRWGWVEKGLSSKPVLITEMRRKGKRERMKRRDSIEAPVNSTNWKEEGGGGGEGKKEVFYYTFNDHGHKPCKSSGWVTIFYLMGTFPNVIWSVIFKRYIWGDDCRVNSSTQRDVKQVRSYGMWDAMVCVIHRFIWPFRYVLPPAHTLRGQKKPTTCHDYLLWYYCSSHYLVFP